MPNLELMEQMTREIEKLKQEVQRLAIQKKLFEVVNVQRVVLSTNQDNWDIPDVDKINIEAGVAAVTINGIANGVNGRLLYLENTLSGTTITLTHNNAAAAAGNKITTPSGASVALAGGRSALLNYSYEVGFLDYGWRVLFFST